MKQGRWKVERKPWKAHAAEQRETAKAEARARRWGHPVRAWVRLAWMLFCGCFALWFVFGGEGARTATFGFLLGIEDWFRGLFRSALRGVG